MKVSHVFALWLTTLSSSLAFKVPNYSSREADPLPERSKLTAFVITEDGLKVECWELDGLVNDSKVTRFDKSNGTVRRESLADSSNLQGVDILSYPPYTTILGPGQDLRTDVNLWGLVPFGFVIQQGVALVTEAVSSLHKTDDNSNQYIFSAENGDNWFYFEDLTTSSNSDRRTLDEDYPLDLSSVGSNPFIITRLLYEQRPKHKVLHKGACNFGGVVNPDQGSSRRALVKNPSEL